MTIYVDWPPKWPEKKLLIPETNNGENKMMSEQIGELMAALSKAQGEMKGAYKDSANPYFKSKYANLAAIIEAGRDTLSKNGLAITQLLNNVEGKLVLESILGHSSGQWIKSTIPILMAKNTPQEMGSAITYAKRYAWAALAGISSTDEDDDGEKAEQGFRDQQKALKEESDIDLDFWNQFASSKEEDQQLLEFIKTRISKGKFTALEVKKSALEKPEKFLSSFQKWLDEKENNLVQQ